MFLVFFFKTPITRSNFNFPWQFELPGSTVCISFGFRVYRQKESLKLVSSWGWSYLKNLIRGSHGFFQVSLNYLTNKVQRNIGLISKIRYFVDLGALNSLYSSLLVHNPTSEYRFSRALIGKKVNIQPYSLSSIYAHVGGFCPHFFNLLG